MTALQRVALLAMVAVVAAACGVPTDAAPRDLAAERLPDGLLTDQATMVSPTREPMTMALLPSRR